jgi:hypothetical protein
MLQSFRTSTGGHSVHPKSGISKMVILLIFIKIHKMGSNNLSEEASILIG